jgi:hypothetical protein
MTRNLAAIVLILFMMGCALALDFENGVEMRPGEKTAERLFEKGIGQPWVGGDPPSFYSFGFKSFDRHDMPWGCWCDPYQRIQPCRYCYSPVSGFYPFYCSSACRSGSWWS